MRYAWFQHSLFKFNSQSLITNNKVEFKKKPPDGGFGYSKRLILQTVIHIKFNRMGGHTQTRNFIRFQLKITVYHVV